ncbi:rRNA methyltransferase 2, mitochondrial-like [Dreissena polymorpha]|uniref:rRNA methyltransferase 2, mitochondrial n=1 Tax=Dreissena polymorpha TaxID=45954 RepID=A0A9D4DDT9_DREPO|nr:rRNA methyltransferase 2, mitochondrial-like [Dreissena polymorpha]KAH3747524.1 hypothetical protein DPMN_181951 [Dreissena polymorpha]
MAITWSVTTQFRTLTVRYFSRSSALGKASKGQSSNWWINRQLNDPYVKQAQEEGWRCRSAFKLIEINKRFELIKPGSVVIDCGASPGSWSQVAAKLSKSDTREGTVIGIDLQQIVPIEGVVTLAGHDFTTSTTQQRIINILNDRLADVILSDMAPSASGTAALDHDRICQLSVAVLKFSSAILTKGGHVLCKIWDGAERDKVTSIMKRMFRSVKIVKPDACRSESAEIYLLGMDFFLDRHT